MKIISFLFIAFYSLSYGLDITPSSLDPDKKRKREREFEEWILPAEAQQEFDEKVDKKDDFPIFYEKKDNKQRKIYISMFDGMTFYSYQNMAKKYLLEKHERFINEGFVLLSLTIHPGFGEEKEYWATWISEKHAKNALKKLEYLGISQAFIKK